MRDSVREYIIPAKLQSIKKGILSKTSGKQYVFFSNDEKDAGESWIREHIHDMPFIYFFARDNRYYKNNISPQSYDLWEMDNVRNIDITSFDKMIEHFFRKGVLSVRMGATVNSQYEMDGCIDFAKKYYSPLIDAYLNYRCKFYIGNISGAVHFTELFSKPYAILSPVIFFAEDDNPLVTSSDKDIMILQKYWDKKRKRYLTLR